MPKRALKGVLECQPKSTTENVPDVTNASQCARYPPVYISRPWSRIRRGWLSKTQVNALNVALA